MSTEEIPVAGKTTLDVNLVADAAMLEEVVVVGYGVSKRTSMPKAATSDITVAELLHDKIERTAIADDDTAVTETIRIRGSGEIENKPPLYIIDGKPVAADAVTHLHPDDIIHISVLHDMEATALYGSRAANGVVLVTTKEPASGKTAIPIIGEKAYRNYLKQNLQQPSDSLCAEAKGKVKLLFYIDEEGNPFNIEITTGLCPSCDEEAVRLIKEGGKWTRSERPVKQTIRFRGRRP
jgi:TonB-dependent SusC/RagA subfamily outer membrane receptor